MEISTPSTDQPVSAPAPPTAPALDATELYVNRELSWLDFNERVLELAEDERMPLLERVKFLSIYTSNLDEFTMIRVAGLHDQVDAGIDARKADGLSPSQTIERLADRTRGLAHRHSHQWEDVLRPALAEHGIRVVAPADCTSEERGRIDRIFDEQVFPVLTPLAVGPGRPFPYMSNLSLSIGVWLVDPVTGTELFARVKVPKEVLPRFIEIGPGTYVPLEDVIARHLDTLFPGMDVRRHAAFRVTRDADFTVSDEADDLVRAVEKELRQRRFGEVVLLEVAADMDRDMRGFLIDQMEIDETQVVDVEGMLDLTDLTELYALDGHKALREAPWTPVVPPRFASDNGKADVLAAMRQGDVLVHHPYESFSASVERFVEQAVDDPDVLAIKMTVYRTSDDSELVPMLIKAAERGKQAVCLVELKARFDERRNIVWARSLEEAGAHVVHGLPGLKTHAKALLVVRREGDGVRHYVHIGTGNYHRGTARLYEDFGLFTCDRDVAADVGALFNALTGAARDPEYRKALVAPDGMRDGLLDEIRRTIAAHEAGEQTRITMKMNSLVDRRCIRALYEAAQAGVLVDLNIRGICCLRAGVPGVSETIRVVSVVGRFLEHSRVYAFQRGDERRCYIGSADLMPRNLDTRVELLIPVEDPVLRAELEDVLERCFEDDSFAWDLLPDGTWKRRTGGNRSVHVELMQRALADAPATE
ncbi:MAG TPA: polyphosphate kinase 1 [Thermoleophilaceae bacterium]|nr:polyphosphate kinase 1 [Thermoleophilaceae bacterium]